MNSLEYIVQAETIKMIAPKFKQRKIIFSSDDFVAVAVMDTRLKRANITEWARKLASGEIPSKDRGTRSPAKLRWILSIISNNTLFEKRFFPSIPLSFTD